MLEELRNEKLIFKIPDKLYHVGEFDIGLKSDESYEGDGLSVSICPSAWCKISKPSSNSIWEVDASNLKLLDYHSVPKENYKEVTQWGVDNGYLSELEGAYAYKYFDDEFNIYIENRYLKFNEEMLEDAGIDEYYSTYAEFKNSEESYGVDIYPIDMYEPTDKLQLKSIVTVSAHNAEEQNFLKYIEENTEYDGIYWDDIFDTSRLTAPRGVIFNSIINSSILKKVDWKDVNELLEEETWF